MKMSPRGAHCIRPGWGRGLLEQVLDPVRPALGIRRVALAAVLEALVEVLEQLALVLGELDRRLHGDVAVQVARVAGAHALDALAAQAEGLAVLRALWQVDLGLAAERRDLDGAAQRRGRHAHGHGAVQVVAVALEDVVLLDADLDVEVARRAAVHAGLAIARRADAHALVDAGRDLDLQRLLLLDLSLAVAAGAGGGNDLAAAVAVRAGLLDAEEALAHVHRAGALAGAAGLGRRAGLGAGAAAGLAAVPARDADLAVLAVRSLFERDLHRVGQVGPAVDLLATAGAAAGTALAAEDVAEYVPEGLGEAAEALGARTAAAHAAVGVHAGVAILVVGPALALVGEHLVGLLGLLEFLLRFLGTVPLVAVRVVLHGQLAVGLLDLVLGGGLGHPQDVVIVTLCHERTHVV